MKLTKRHLRELIETELTIAELGGLLLEQDEEGGDDLFGGDEGGDEAAEEGR